MGETTGIAWCHHSFNPWWGCVEVSPACDHCYARTDATRYGHAVWGKDAPRRFFGDHHWTEPLRWARKAEAAGERRRVFCASMADVFEERDDEVGQAMQRARQNLWFVIANTPALDWLLLTKRPAGMRRLLPPEIAALPNVWPGVTVESPEYLWRLDQLMEIAAAGPRWLSLEPQLGPVDLSPYLGGPRDERRANVFGVEHRGPKDVAPRTSLDWVVTGGESGPRARSFDLSWARRTIAQCRAVGVPVFCKQLGARPVIDLGDGHRDEVRVRPLHLSDRRAGSNPDEWPADLRVREFPGPTA